MKLYKVLAEGGRCKYGQGTWSLPSDGRPGEWMPRIEGLLVPCENGYHLCTMEQLPQWLLDEEIYESEHRGQIVVKADNVLVRQPRLILRLNWDECVARLFACDCAEHVLHLFERDYPDDDRPRCAIEVARRYADGAATADELAATRDAAWAAAEAAVGDAAWNAARAAEDAAADTAWDGVGDGAAAVAWNAAADAAGNAAADAARNAAWDAAWAAAGDAAGAAERRWQVQRLRYYLYTRDDR